MTEEPSPVYMLHKTEGQDSRCNRMALDFTNTEYSSMSLYDKEDPAMGVSLKLMEGDYCCPHAGTCSDSEYKQITFTFDLRCADAINSIPEETSVDTINNGCDYLVTFRTIHACPVGKPRLWR